MRKLGWVGVSLCVLGAWAQQRPVLDYPLAPKTRWTYHLHHENGPGVHFNEELARLVKNNVLDATLVSEAAGVEKVGPHAYTRVETRLNGKPWLFEWERLAADGLLVAKSVDFQNGEGVETVLLPEQRRIATNLRPGNFWYWQAKEAPVRFRYNVLGPGQVDVGAGHYACIRLNDVGTLDMPFGKMDVRQDTWFVPGVGIARQETQTSIKGRLLSKILLTLDKFEPGR